MTTEAEIVEHKSFQERLVDRLRESIGDLITDQDLRGFVERGVEEVFFTETFVRSTYGGPTETIPPVIHQMVKEVLKERMAQAVADWLRDHENEVKQAVEDCVRDGAGAALVRGLNVFLDDSMMRLQSNVQNQLLSGR